MSGLGLDSQANHLLMAPDWRRTTFCQSSLGSMLTVLKEREMWLCWTSYYNFNC